MIHWLTDPLAAPLTDSIHQWVRLWLSHHHNLNPICGQATGLGGGHRLRPGLRPWVMAKNRDRARVMARARDWVTQGVTVFSAGCQKCQKRACGHARGRCGKATAALVMVFWRQSRFLVTVFCPAPGGGRGGPLAQNRSKSKLSNRIEKIRFGWNP